MLCLSSKVRYYLYRGVTDMRKSFEGLAGLVRQELAGDPQSRDVYLFVNRRLERIKLLVWDRDGYWQKTSANWPKKAWRCIMRMSV